MTKQTKSIKQKLFFSAMVLAFMWVIIGDLVAIHLELIYGNKNSNWHQPYTKTHKDDQQTYKVKTQKTDGSSKVKHHSFISSSTSKTHIALQDYHYYNINTQLLHSQHLGLRYLRGPPSTC